MFIIICGHFVTVHNSMDDDAFASELYGNFRYIEHEIAVGNDAPDIVVTKHAIDGDSNASDQPEWTAVIRWYAGECPLEVSSAFCDGKDDELRAVFQPVFERISELFF